jgi:hypothetical protein
MAACVIATVGLVCDLFAESLFVGWLPDRMETVAPLGTFLSGGVANGLYALAGTTLTLGTRSLRGLLCAWAWATWTSGFTLTVCTLMANVIGIMISTAILMSLFCPWVAIFGWKLNQDNRGRLTPLKR